MFDIAIINTDRFIDLSMSAKAVYFLMGMEADQEGFVSYKKVLKVHNGSYDDVKNLIDNDFIIVFESGVAVITDWHTNNYLNSTRKKPTQYQKEKALLSIMSVDIGGVSTSDKRYVLNKCLTSVQPKEKKRKEKKRKEEGYTASPTPSQIAQDFFKKGDNYSELLKFFSQDKDQELVAREFDKFILYWTEPNKSGTKLRWEQQSTFEVKRRLHTWMGNVRNFISRETKQVIY